MNSCLDEAESSTQAPPSGRRAVLRMLLLGAVLIGAMAAVQLSPVRAWLQDGQRLKEALAALGWWEYPLCIVVVAVMVGCGVPRLLFCAAGGAALGFWWGLTITEVGGVLGYYGAFVFIRWGGREWVLHRWPALRKWAGVIHDHGVLGVVLLRQVPMHGTLVNLCLGLSHVKHRHFLLGTAIGLLPEAIPATLIGAGLVKGSLKHSAGYLALAGLVFVGLWIAGGYGLRALRSNRSAAAALAEAAALKGVES